MFSEAKTSTSISAAGRGGELSVVHQDLTVDFLGLRVLEESVSYYLCASYLAQAVKF